MYGGCRLTAPALPTPDGMGLEPLSSDSQLLHFLIESFKNMKHSEPVELQSSYAAF